MSKTEYYTPIPYVSCSISQDYLDRLNWTYKPLTPLKDAEYFKQTEEFNLITEEIDLLLDNNSMRISLSYEIATNLISVLQQLEKLENSKINIELGQEYEAKGSEFSATKLIIYKFTTQDRVIVNRKFSRNRLDYYVNCVVSVEVAPGGEVEIYIDQYGTYFLIDLLKKIQPEYLYDHVFLSVKEDPGGDADILSPELIGSADNQQIIFVNFCY
ncbi:MAG: hypothetical protein ACK4M7_00445 [Burkholderiales bacterium]